MSVEMRLMRRAGLRSCPLASLLCGFLSVVASQARAQATDQAPPLVLQATLVETGARFRLRARTMLELDRAGVPDEVTDLMVALSYPDRFRVARLEGSSGGGQGPAPEGWGEWPSDAYPWGYAPFAYSYWQFNDYWYSQGVIVIGDDGDNGHPGGGGGQSGGGRVVNGQGYTRIEPVSGAHATREDSSSSDSTSSTASSSGESSAVSSEGYSSGGSSGDSGRTAQPRPPD
jgi:hypothetical protein